MRVKFAVTLLFLALAAFLLGPSTGVSQGPRGGGGRGGFGGGGGGWGGGNPPDAGVMFDWLAKGKATIKITDLSRGRDQATAWAAKNNITNGEFTKEQWAEYTQSLTGGPRPGTQEGADPAASPPQPGDRGGAWGGRGQGRGGPGGLGGDINTTADILFKRADRNGDGVLQVEEMSETLLAEKDKWDTNKDGVIDMNEYREYMKAWQEKYQPKDGQKPAVTTSSSNPGDSRGTLPPGATIGGDEPPAYDLDKKVVVLRAGKLGDKMPSWFTEYDTDKDAQVALYEWKEKGGDLTEFRKWDLNGDGFITPDEVLRVIAMAGGKDVPTPGSSSGDRRTASAGPGDGNGGGAAGFFGSMFGGGRRGQGGGGAPGGGRNKGGQNGGGMTADSMFDRFANGRSSFNISEAGFLEASLTDYAQKTGLSGGTVNQQQFRDYWAQREAERADKGGNPGGGRRQR